MGEVWLAEQTEPVSRQVALKVIKAGMDSAQVIARFEAERQALAMMDHPAIATVFEGGTTPQGRPYFAMEYVKGEPITAYCDRHRLGTAQRLELFSQVCEGVQHAHLKGIIHRDLKPSNVLVTIQDDRPMPRIIDFGVAKAVATHLTERTLYTELGVLIGTPEYMSPEQAEMGGLDVDTRTDVYALGVMLYELLTGALPFDRKDLRQAGLAEIQRIIREKEPPRPSTRVTLLGLASTEAAKNRDTEPRRLANDLQGDLDWVTMRALEKDRTRRYQTANALAADVRRHLQHEPVLAGPPSAAYRTGKFVRRHRFGVAVAAAAVLLLVGFAVAMTLQARRIARERDRADQEASAARQVSEFLVGLFKISDPSENRGNQVTAREILNRGAERIDQELKGQPLLQARLMSTMGEVYQSLGLYEPAGRLFDASLERRKNLLGSEHELVAESLNLIGALRWGRGDYDQAEVVLRQALDMRRKLLGPEHPDVATTLDYIGHVLNSKGASRESEPIRRQALAIRRKAYPGDSAAVAASLGHLAIELKEQRKYSEAEPLYKEALAMDRRVFGANHPTVASKTVNLGMLYLDRARFEADSGQRPADLASAESLLREGLETNLRLFGEPHPEVTINLNNLGIALTEKGAFEEAEKVLRRALDRSAPDNPTRLNVVRVNLAGLLRRLNRHGEAEPIYRQLIEHRVKTFSRSNWQVSSAESQLGDCLVALGRFSEAEPLIVDSYVNIQKQLGDSHPATEAAARRVPKLYEIWGKTEEVEKWRKKLPARPKK